MRGLTSDPCPTLDAAAQRYGSTFAVGAGALRMVIVGDPTHLADLFATPNDAFRWGHWLNVLRFFVGDSSMIVSDGEQHRRRRSHVQPGFARRYLDEWIPMIVAETDRTIDEEILGRDGVVDLFPIERTLVLRMVLNVLFGAGLNERVDEIARLLEPAKEYLEQSALRQIPHPIPFTRRSRARAARQQLDRLLDEEMTRRRAGPPGLSPDLLDTVLAAPGRDRLSDVEIRDQVLTLIGAGYDTTTSALSWTTLRAAAEPEVWAKLRSEADNILVADLGPDTIRRLTYAHAVVRETLRLHPAGVFSPRQAVRDVHVGPYTIPRRAMILWSPYLAGRDPAVWGDPLTFRPERHLDPDPETAALAATAWVPFGRGPRRCPGFALAQMELALVISRLTQRLDLRLEAPEIPHPHGMVVNRPTGGVRAWAQRRQPQNRR
jgi:cytochrome P450